MTDRHDDADPVTLHLDALEACGKAFGFVLAAAKTDLAGPEPITYQRLHAFAGSLHTLVKADRFSPDVSVVLNGVIEGMLSHLTAGKLAEGQKPLI